MDDLYLNFLNADEERADGLAKVTGKAKFTADQKVQGMLYGVLVCSTIAKGYIKNMVLYKARNAPGVVDIFYYLNSLSVPGFKPDDKNKNPYRGLKIFHNNIIHSNGQPVALVVADTYERAVHAASLVEIQYHQEPHVTDFDKERINGSRLKSPEIYERGDTEAWQKGDARVSLEFNIPIETHNPLEPHATLAVWEGQDRLTVYDKTQGPKVTQAELARMFGLEEKNVRVITEFVGGAFGSALRSWPHVYAAVIAARKLGRPVKLVLTREQMFTMVGYRPQSWQRISISAEKNGKLVGIFHEAVSNTSSYEDFREGIVNGSQFLYQCPNVTTRYQILPLDINTPIWMRAPGPATGAVALECALDELSYALQIDPIELRLINDTDIHPVSKLPWTTKYLKECYALGKEKIGWKNRPALPATLKENEMLTGYGMAVGWFWAGRGMANVKAILKADGKIIFQSAVSDMGPGTTTAMLKIASEQMEIDHHLIRFELGDTDYPFGPMQGGSGSLTAVGSAVIAACEELKNEIKKSAVEHITEFKSLKPQDLIYQKGFISSSTKDSLKYHYTEILDKAGKEELNVTKSSGWFERSGKYEAHSFSVHFAKVRVHPETGVVHVSHIVSVADAGKIISYTTARSQMIGGAVGGIGMAMTEAAILDHRYGRYITANLADYHIPVHADVPKIDVLFVNKEDRIISPTGAKGIGEIAIAGVAPAILNAIYNATGKRITDLPVTPDKLIERS